MLPPEFIALPVAAVPAALLLLLLLLFLFFFSFFIVFFSSSCFVIVFFSSVSDLQETEVTVVAKVEVGMTLEIGGRILNEEHTELLSHRRAVTTSVTTTTGSVGLQDVFYVGQHHGSWNQRHQWDQGKVKHTRFLYQ